MRELLRAESLGDAARDDAARATGRPKSFIGGLLEREPLPAAPPPPLAPGEQRPNPLGRLLAREPLPVDPVQVRRPTGPGLMHMVFRREALPPADTAGSAPAARKPWWLGRLLERETLPHEPALANPRRPSLLHMVLSFESLEERTDKNAN